MVDNAAFGFLVTAALAIFDPVSKAFQEFITTFLNNFLLVSAEFFPKFQKKLFKHSAGIALSLTTTVFDFFLLHCTHILTKFF